MHIGVGHVLIRLAGFLLALIKGLLLLSASLLCTAALLRWWLDAAHRTARLLTVAAGLLLLVLSVLDVWFTLQSVTGFVDRDLFLRYVNTTRHGTAFSWRLVLTGAFTVLALLPARRSLLALLVPAWLLLLGTFSYTSHASAMAGTGALLLDWLHFIAGSAWIGVILAAGLARRVWADRGQLLRMMSAVSATGLAAVILVLASGTVSSLFHVAEPERFFGSPYSWALGVKIVLVLLTVGVAALNRFRFLPRLRAGGDSAGLRTSLFYESILLLAVFAATGVLTTSSLPHGQDFPGLLENVNRLVNHLWR